MEGPLNEMPHEPGFQHARRARLAHIGTTLNPTWEVPWTMPWSDALGRCFGEMLWRGALERTHCEVTRTDSTEELPTICLNEAISNKRT